MSYPMHEKPMPYPEMDFYLPMGGPPDDEPTFDEDALPAHPDDDHRTSAAYPTPLGYRTHLDTDIPF